MSRYIDADELLKFIDNTVDDKDLLVNSYNADWIYSFIESATTVDAVPVVHGEWILRGGKRYCSACGEKACVTRDREDFWYTVGTNYCPNCGARCDL